MREFTGSMLLLLSLLALALNVNLQPACHVGPVTIETTSVPEYLDGPELQISANPSSFDY
jgi:hypothetical protein